MKDLKVPMRMVMLSPTYDTQGTRGRGKFYWRALDISHLVQQARKFCGKDLLGYGWVAEVQASGTPHYHLILFIRVGPKQHLPFPDKAGWWRFGDTSLTSARSPFYLAKYVGKEAQKNFNLYPPGMRLFAVWIADKALKLILRIQSLDLLSLQIYTLTGSFLEAVKWKSCWKPYLSNAPPCEFVGALTQADYVGYAAARGL